MLTTYELPVLDCTGLSRSAKYRITGESGEWRLTYEEACGMRSYYTFWRFDKRDINRRITRRISQELVYQRVCEISETPRYAPIDLSKFESLRGE